MRSRLLPLIAITVLVCGAALAAQESSRVPLPEWMTEFLPKTPEERARAAIFDSRGDTLLRLGINTLLISCGGMFLESDARPLYAEYLSELVCDFENAIVGVPTPVAVRINNRGTFLFTEHRVRVSRWIRPENPGPLEIDVVTAGGLLALGKNSVGVQVGEDLEAGKEYLLFLKRVPSTTAFSVVNRALHEGMPWAESLPQRYLPHELEDGDVPFDRFIDDLANAAMRCPKSPRTH